MGFTFTPQPTLTLAMFPNSCKKEHQPFTSSIAQAIISIFRKIDLFGNACYGDRDGDLGMPPSGYQNPAGAGVRYGMINRRWPGDQAYGRLGGRACRPLTPGNRPIQRLRRQYLLGPFPSRPCRSLVNYSLLVFRNGATNGARNKRLTQKPGRSDTKT